jgi:hypothetical protein
MVPRGCSLLAAVLILAALRSIWYLAAIDLAPPPLQAHAAAGFNLRAVIRNATSVCAVAEKSARGKYALALCTVRELARSHVAWQREKLRVGHFTRSDSIFTYTPGARPPRMLAIFYVERDEGSVIECTH